MEKGKSRSKRRHERARLRAFFHKYYSNRTLYTKIENKQIAHRNAIEDRYIRLGAKRDRSDHESHRCQKARARARARERERERKEREKVIAVLRSFHAHRVKVLPSPLGQERGTLTIEITAVSSGWL